MGRKGRDGLLLLRLLPLGLESRCRDLLLYSAGEFLLTLIQLSTPRSETLHRHVRYASRSVEAASSPFASHVVPSIPLEDYLDGILRDSGAGIETLIVSLVYLSRVQNRCVL